MRFICRSDPLHRFIEFRPHAPLRSRWLQANNSQTIINVFKQTSRPTTWEGFRFNYLSTWFSISSASNTSVTHIWRGLFRIITGRVAPFLKLGHIRSVSQLFTFQRVQPTFCRQRGQRTEHARSKVLRGLINSVGVPWSCLHDHISRFPWLHNTISYIISSSLPLHKIALSTTINNFKHHSLVVVEHIPLQHVLAAL